MNRRAGALGVSHHRHNLRQQSVGADLFCPHQQSAGPIHRRTDQFGVSSLGHRHRFTRHHRFVDIAAPVEDCPVDRHFLAGTHPQGITGLNLIQGDIFFLPIRADDARGIRRQGQEHLNGGIGARAGPQLENLAKKDQSSDDCGSFKVDGDQPAFDAHDRREAAGED